MVKKLETFSYFINFMDILKISIAIAIVGIITLFFIVQFNNETVEKINDLKIGQISKITGMITSAFVSKNDDVFLKVADDTGEISVVAFKKSNIDTAYYLENGDQVSVTGRVEEYKGSLEIIASKIEKI